MTLHWSPSGTHTVEAFGHKAHYTLRRAPGAFTGCVLTAEGHDGLPMLILPPYGKHFDRPADAKQYAERIEWTKTLEPQGGAG